MRKVVLVVVLGALLSWQAQAAAENYTLKGDMDSSIRYDLRERIVAGEGVKKLVLSFVKPQSFQSPTYNQDVKNFTLTFKPDAEEKTTSRDDRGNEIITAVWNNAPDSIDVLLSCDAASETKLPTLATQAAFPLTKLDDATRVYLRATDQVQAKEPRIQELASQLTKDVKTEYDAVQQVIAWVIDHVHYVTPPQRYDAIYSLESGKGNCQNFSHLSAAILRAAGIPVRIVNGVTLNQPYDINWKQGVLTFKMGQGRHSWIEVWFPDLGWVPFDPQNSVLFVSNRFIRVEVGMDNNETKNDGLMRWIQGKEAKSPTLQETIGAKFQNDRVSVSGDRETYGPKNVLLTPAVKAEFKQIEIKPPPPVPVIPEIARKELRYEVPFLFGNLEFPLDVDFAFPRSKKASGHRQFEMSKNFLVETAEYVTTNATQYAQVVVLNKPVKLEKVGLALHNYGGDGWLWVDIFADDQGKPGAPLSTSDIISLSEISPRPGYRWVDFDFKKGIPELMPGAYWIALGFTGSPVVNWFYTYGKPVGPVDGTRYKSIFQENWSGALSYEFNYRVQGKTIK